MSCFHPLTGFKTLDGKVRVGEWRPGSGAYVTVACGQCIGCRIDRSKDWAIRCVHEAQMHEDNVFLTLTYNDENLPPGGTLRPEDINRFIRKLRKIEYKKAKKSNKPAEQIRYLQCGEYGETTDRPHHHAILFGYEFTDKYLWTQRGGHNVFRSPTLERLWPHGQSEIGSVTRESAGYVARYIMKKINGDEAEKHYQGKKPEYITMSRNPGIGKAWFEKYWTDVYPQDHCIIDGKENRPPKYYDKLYKELDPEGYEILIKRRESFAQSPQQQKHTTPKRLEQRETVLDTKINRLKRTI